MKSFKSFIITEEVDFNKLKNNIYAVARENGFKPVKNGYNSHYGVDKKSFDNISTTSFDFYDNTVDDEIPLNYRNTITIGYKEKNHELASVFIKSKIKTREADCNVNNIELVLKKLIKEFIP